MRKVFIGVGHGGRDPGAVGYLKEADVNLQMALGMQEILLEHGVSVEMSRTSNMDDPLTEEIKEANSYKPDIAIDVHNNAGGGNGFEVFYQTNNFELSSIRLSKSLELEVINLGQNSRGLKFRKNTSSTDYFGFLREVKCPAVIVEGVFVDNKEDVKIADTKDKQRAFGRAYGVGVLNYLGVPLKNENPSSDWAKDSIKWAVKARLTDDSKWQEKVTKEQVICYLDRFSNLGGKL